LSKVELLKQNVPRRHPYFIVYAPVVAQIKVRDGQIQYIFLVMNRTEANASLLSF